MGQSGRWTIGTRHVITYGGLMLLSTCMAWLPGCRPAPKTDLSEVQQDPIRPPKPVDTAVWQPADTLPSDWVDLIALDSTIQMSLKYATVDNFVEEQMYPCQRCLLRPEVAQALLGVQIKLRAMRLGLKVFDCYRPHSIQQRLWDKVPDATYVTPPDKGSMHNRGAAVDLTLVTPAGDELDMGTAFDHFGPKAHHTYLDLDPQVLANRQLLKEQMAAGGFGHIRTEWWHYSYRSKTYEIADYRWSCPGVWTPVEELWTDR